MGGLDGKPRPAIGVGRRAITRALPSKLRHPHTATPPVPHPLQPMRLFPLVSLLLAASACAPAADDPPPPRSTGGSGADLVEARVVSRVAFGSCAREDRDQDIWSAIVDADPDLFLFAGDNVYVDLPEVPTRREEFTAAYAALGAKPGWLALQGTCPVLATWDDHDYGKDDAGVEWALKGVAQEAFLDFFGVPEGSPRRAREGVYHSSLHGPEGRRLQVILLDTRTHRTALTRNRGDRGGRGPYLAKDRPDQSMLGAEQWAWLEGQLRIPADLRLIVSSIQVVADEHGWEGWCNMPAERARLLGLIEETGAAGVVFLTGDRHLIELSRLDGGAYPLWDFTSSGFNWGSKTIEEPNRFRVGPVMRVPNFGVIEVDWDGEDPEVTLTGRGLEGERLLGASFPLSALRPGS